MSFCCVLEVGWVEGGIRVRESSEFVVCGGWWWNRGVRVEFVVGRFCGSLEKRKGDMEFSDMYKYLGYCVFFFDVRFLVVVVEYCFVIWDVVFFKVRRSLFFVCEEEELSLGIVVLILLESVFKFFCWFIFLYFSCSVKFRDYVIFIMILGVFYLVVLLILKEVFL